ncbi:MAG TPA: hypothetical protein VES42_02875, partial [Pilimelia sp.]|nr:hypothetical protein [Pilimelia sp.]
MTREPWPDPFADQPDWTPQPPAAIIAVPATGNRDLRGRRVIVGLPGLGWRADLRGDEAVVQGSRTYVPVLTEAEWYRAEAEQTEVFAPLVPLERVWVETVAASPAKGADRPADVVSRLVSLDAPPRREPVSVIDAGALTGRRVVRVLAGATRRDLRAVTELHAGADGDICVRVAAELDWYRWA